MRAPGFYFRPPGLASFLLLPLGMIYGAVASFRMRRQGTRVGVPTICVGNPTLGGSGKTPTAIAVAQLLAGMGAQPAFVSRGYGGGDAGPVLVDAASHGAAAVGDEPLLLARHFPTVVARDRVAGARLATASGASVLVLDDGFQNPALAKDCSLLVVDAASGVGNGDVFPAGPLRAPLASQLALAHGMVRVGAAESANAVEVQAKLMGLPVFGARLLPVPQVAAELKGEKVLAFAGIGRPEKFFSSLRELGARVIEARGFGDHHRYSPREARELIAAAGARGLTLVTTEKDFARMQDDAALAELAAASKVLPVRLQFDDEEGVRRLLERALGRARG